MQWFADPIRRFCRDRKAAIAPAMAIALPVFLTVIGMAVEYQHWEGIRANFQNTADSAAYSVALDVAYDSGSDVIDQTIATIAQTAGQAGSTVTYHIPPISGQFAGQSGYVQSEVRGLAPRYLTRILFQGDYDILARAVARFESNDQDLEDACVMALSADADAAITIAGSIELNLSLCLLVSRSLSDSSLKLSGAASVLDLGCISLAGGADISGGVNIISALTSNLTTLLNGTVRLNGCESIQENQAPRKDPYQRYQRIAQDIVDRTTNCRPLTNAERRAETLPAPSWNAALQSVPTTCIEGDVSLSQLQNDGEVVLEPGVYIIKSGTLRVNANTKVVGEGVTFILADGANLDFSGAAGIDLTAPDHGDTQGMLVMSDASVTRRDHKFVGGADTALDGVFYLPGGDLKVAGNASLQPDSFCVQLIADTVALKGNTGIFSASTSTGLNIGCPPSYAEPDRSVEVALVE